MRVQNGKVAVFSLNCPLNGLFNSFLLWFVQRTSLRSRQTQPGGRADAVVADCKQHDVFLPIKRKSEHVCVRVSVSWSVLFNVKKLNGVYNVCCVLSPGTVSFRLICCLAPTFSVRCIVVITLDLDYLGITIKSHVCYQRSFALFWVWQVTTYWSWLSLDVTGHLSFKSLKFHQSLWV